MAAFAQLQQLQQQQLFHSSKLADLDHSLTGAHQQMHVNPMANIGMLSQLGAGSQLNAQMAQWNLLNYQGMMANGNAQVSRLK